MFYPRLVTPETHPQSATEPEARAPMQGAETRAYEIAWRGRDGSTERRSLIAPGLPIFREAVTGFAHGTPIQTSGGPVAVEDLEPGMELARPDGGTATLIWKGSGRIDGASDERLYRITAGAFGLGRPAQDLLLGAGARLLGRAPRDCGPDAVLLPVELIADGAHVIELNPAAPVRVYHLACAQHETILAGGLEVESYHPGPCMAFVLEEHLARAFLALFPHLASFGDFGPVRWHRLDAQDLAQTA